MHNKGKEMKERSKKEKHKQDGRRVRNERNMEPLHRQEEN
jgi:hypothetical protein